MFLFHLFFDIYVLSRQVMRKGYKNKRGVAEIHGEIADFQRLIMDDALYHQERI
jgi:hypothetical protein